MLFLSFDKAQKYENGQDRIFSRPWRDMAPNYIFGSLPLRCFFFRMFHCFCCIFTFFSFVLTFFHYFLLLFIVFQLFKSYSLSFDKGQKYENGQDRIFRDPGVTLLQIIYIYIWKPSIAWIFFSVFHFFCCICLYSWSIR